MKIFSTLFTTLILTGCASTEKMFVESKPSEVAEGYLITSIETPTRVIGKSNYRKHIIDLAYFLPSLKKCTEEREKCDALSKMVLGKKVWVQKEYERYGLPLHTLWQNSSLEAVNSVNLELILNGYPDAQTDNRKLPNGKSKIVSRANEIGIERLRQKRILKTLPKWRLDNIEDATELENFRRQNWQVK